jgi:major type 1 subunit fimbrin (pilin)
VNTANPTNTNVITASHQPVIWRRRLYHRRYSVYVAIYRLQWGYRRNGYVVVFTDKNPGSNTTLLEAFRTTVAATDVGIEVDHAGKALDFSAVRMKCH